MLTNPTILALDVGAQRIGVARANTIARIASPLVTLTNDSTTFDEITALITSEDVGALVVGLPRGLEGQETAQTQTIRDFVTELKAKTDLPVYFQDEALTSRKAEDELESRGKPFSKGDIDALAATFILEDFLQDNMELFS
jgi:putative Holliday junction resolvase